jgi:hypothetical protein
LLEAESSVKMLRSQLRKMQQANDDPARQRVAQNMHAGRPAGRPGKAYAHVSSAPTLPRLPKVSGVEGGGGGGGVYRRRRANTTWRRSDRNVPRPEGSVDADEGESSSSFEEDLRNFRGERVYKARGGIGSSLDGRGRGGIGSSLDAGRGARGGRSSSNSNSNSRGGIGSSLDGSVDASGSVDGSMDDLYRSYVLGDAAADRWDDDDERGDSLDDELRQSWLKDSGYYSVDETIDDR